MDRLFISTFVTIFLICLFSMFFYYTGERRRITCYDEIYNPAQQTFAAPRLIYDSPATPYYSSSIANNLALFLEYDDFEFVFFMYSVGLALSTTTFLTLVFLLLKFVYSILHFCFRGHLPKINW